MYTQVFVFSIQKVLLPIHRNIEMLLAYFGKLFILFCVNVTSENYSPKRSVMYAGFILENRSFL